MYPIDGALASTTTPGQRKLGSNDNERVLHSPQSSRTGFEYLMSYPVYSLGRGSYPSAEVLSFYYYSCLELWLEVKIVYKN